MKLVVYLNMSANGWKFCEAFVMRKVMVSRDIKYLSMVSIKMDIGMERISN